MQSTKTNPHINFIPAPQEGDLINQMLPNEILSLIFTLLPKDTKNIALVNRKWYKISINIIKYREINKFYYLINLIQDTSSSQLLKEQLSNFSMEAYTKIVDKTKSIPQIESTATKLNNELLKRLSSICEKDLVELEKLSKDAETETIYQNIVLLSLYIKQTRNAFITFTEPDLLEENLKKIDNAYSNQIKLKLYAYLLQMTRENF